MSARSGATRVLLEAAEGLVLRHGPSGALEVGFGEEDWLGPLELRLRGGAGPGAGGLELSPRAGSDALGGFGALAVEGLEEGLRCSVRAYPDLPALFFTIATDRDRRGLATGSFVRPSIGWPSFRPLARDAARAPAGLRSYGHQYSEFALPMSGDDACRGFAMAGHRPPVAEPLLFVAEDLRTLLLSPFQGFHEQVVVVPGSPDEASEGIRCGWHGDLEEAPAGFATELVLLAAPAPRAALERLGDWLRRRHATRRPSRYADDGVGKLSYWTDNGAVYYYRTEPGEDYATTLSRTVASLHEAGIPVRSLQLDSWFYPHETLRPVSVEGAPVVPPTGMMRWEPREDLFADGFAGLRERLGGLPLTFHSRHFSKQSPYFAATDGQGGGHAAWRDVEFAHPTGPALYEQLLEQAAGWGAITYEQDWMVESFLGVRGLRAAPGRARAWQEGMDRAARERGMTLQWCMASPADMLQTVTLTQVTSVRTSGDYRYMFDNGLNWVWFLHGNALARALGLNPYKDVFITHGDAGLGPAERFSEVESLLASLSTGPVGIGDRRGHGDRALVLRSCREDGVLVKPDLPLAALDRCFRENAFLRPVPLVAETCSRHGAGTWIYLVVLHASRKQDPIAYEVALAELGALAPQAAVVAYDWRSGAFRRLEPDAVLRGELAWQDFSYTVLCPIVAPGLALFGDVTRWATMGDRRVAHVEAGADGIAFDLLGTPGSGVAVEGWSQAEPRAASLWSPTLHRSLPVRRGGASLALEEGLAWDPDGGRFRLRTQLGPQGRVRVALAV